MNVKPDVAFAAFAGIDWADAKHDIGVQGECKKYLTDNLRA